ncbi:hypothetical protein AGMMS49938_06280 [Fibrobacterales bacterium]|nr:hypothetical protein AGMMS49938_06280 [Fibrobacterales bacterium]
MILSILTAMNYKLQKNPILNALRDVILQERGKQNLTQAEFARRCGLSRNYIVLLESGLRMPRLDSVFMLACGFDISVVHFFELLMLKLIENNLKKPANLAADHHSKVRWNSIEFAVNNSQKKELSNNSKH